MAYVPGLAFVFLSMAKEKVEIEYKFAALVDPLTGVPNRRAFLENAQRLVRSAGHKPVSCLIFDLDRFKDLNDSFGHDIGDRVLHLFGEVLSRHLPAGSYGRLGGEEFSAVIALHRAEAEVVAQRIRADFSNAGKLVGGEPIMVTVSVGCSTAAGESPETLIQKADVALYQAKRSGRNSVVTALPD
ncbi:GGDEF domain-containing protein [Microvirga roseola]|uniref:GGDEF domain-containing protein n=1 Tax=Microvirga roseola TaxID=2883126 RepID=UPI001E358DE5|nr:GGDEF domain-containing protein [Microvirga roseola]